MQLSESETATLCSFRSSCFGPLFPCGLYFPVLLVFPPTAVPQRGRRQRAGILLGRSGFLKRYGWRCVRAERLAPDRATVSSVEQRKKFIRCTLTRNVAQTQAERPRKSSGLEGYRRSVGNSRAVTVVQCGGGAVGRHPSAGREEWEGQNRGR